jgi:ABC-type dipeptide/oligopeptide/nickel transport system ATPase component
MADKEVILRVKDLRISFRTVSGKVQAVRGISFNLFKGETLAIVGESGSGKSVTNRAIMGILAKNGIIESGEVLYDGRDLLRISEEEYCRIRGDKIAMIFQDPLSSLNPIIRIGRQLTEATLLKNKANRRDAKENYNNLLKNLGDAIVAANGNSEEAKSANEKMVATFRAIEKYHLTAQVPYNSAYSALENAQADLADLLFNCRNKIEFDLKEIVKEFLVFSKATVHPYVVTDEKAVEDLNGQLKAETQKLLKAKAKTYEVLVPLLEKYQALFDAAKALEKPDFFAYGYYLEAHKEEIPANLSTKEKNELAIKEMVEKFVLPFNAEATKGLLYDRQVSREAMGKALEVLKKDRPSFDKDPYVKAETKALAKEMVAAVNATINPLEFVKDSYTYTFATSLSDALNRYYKGIVTNAKETKRFAKQKATYDAKVKAGKTPDWKPVPANVLPRELLIHNITKVIDNLIELYSERLASNEVYDAEAEAKKIIPYLKDQSSLSVYKVTPSMAKTTAIKLMKEVGIAEPRRRFRQYPFEFSGGMRQRIVIAIALAANPEILICDEPTTALDVTIQAQILELINKIKEERKLSVIFITHNLGASSPTWPIRSPSCMPARS